MGTLVRDILMQSLADLRYEPVPKRIRAWLGGRVVIDTDRAVLVWEPKRVVPSYAVPVEQVADVLEPAFASVEWQESAPDDADTPHLGDRPVYDPRVPFGVHTTDGEPLDIRSGDTERRAAAFRPTDAALNDYVVAEDIAWSYPQPLREADEIAGRIAFFNERVDLVIDGHRLARPITPWSH